VKKLVSAIPAELKCETRNSCYHLQCRYIYFIVSKQIITIFYFFVYSWISILPRNPFIIKIVHPFATMSVTSVTVRVSQKEQQKSQKLTAHAKEQKERARLTIAEASE
jgi:hypothetical protein